jgi:uncharacterized protein DUF5678
MTDKTLPRARKVSRPYIDRSRELAWLAEHERNYAGQWVVLEGERLIGHGADPTPFVDEARAEGIECPFVVHCRTWFGPSMGGWLYT